MNVNAGIDRTHLSNGYHSFSIYMCKIGLLAHTKKVSTANEHESNGHNEPSEHSARFLT